jgi:DNA invertase Pin-like site-specific DNA recombinase
MGHSNRADVRCEGSDGQVVEVADYAQDTAAQLDQVRQYVARRQWGIAVAYIDYAMGGHVDRRAFRRLLEDASKHSFDVVAVWALDRFTHDGVLKTFEYIRKLGEFGVQFESCSEPHFRTTERDWQLVTKVAAWIAEQQRLRFSERTKAGLERARQKGRRCGRPRRNFRRDEALKLREEGMSWRKIARQLKVPASTVRLAVRRIQLRRGKKS